MLTKYVGPLAAQLFQCSSYNDRDNSFRGKTCSEEPANVLGSTFIDLFLLRFKNLSKSPISFSVISIGKLANLQVHLDN